MGLELMHVKLDPGQGHLANRYASHPTVIYVKDIFAMNQFFDAVDIGKVIESCIDADINKNGDVLRNFDDMGLASKRYVIKDLGYEYNHIKGNICLAQREVREDQYQDIINLRFLFKDIYCLINDEDEYKNDRINQNFIDAFGNIIRTALKELESLLSYSYEEIWHNCNEESFINIRLNSDALSIYMQLLENSNPDLYAYYQLILEGKDIHF